MNRWFSRLPWVAAYLLAVWIFRSAVVDLNYVAGRSMYPTLLPGDIVLVNKLAYGISVPFTAYRLMNWGQPRRGDMVILVGPGKENWLVKRVAGLPGDGIRPGRVVPPGHYYVLGDNRAESSDSRHFGSVAQSRLVGQVVGVAVSFDPARWYWPRWKRFGR